MTTLRLTAALDLRAAADGGKVPTFSMVAYRGGPMMIAGWADPVVVDLAGVDVLTATLPIFLNHEPGKIIGHGEPTVSATEIAVDGVVSADNIFTQDVVKSSKNGFPWQASIGATVQSSEILRKGKSEVVNGRKVEGPAVILRKTTLDEISFVPLGADRSTSATVAAMKGKIMSEAPPTAPTSEELELDRVRALHAAADKYTADRPDHAGVIEAKLEEALAAGTSAAAFELDVLRSSRPVGPSNIHGARRGNDVDTLTAALVISAGGSPEFLVTRGGFDQQTVDAAMMPQNRDVGLHDVIRAVIARAGREQPRRINDDAIRTAYHAGRSLQATGFSTFSVPGIFSSVMNKLLLESYASVNSVARRICSTRPVRDFRESTGYRLTGSGVFEKIGADGELKHGTLSEAGYSNKADTFGKIYAVTRQDIINDDLGALQRIPRLLGRQAALALEEAVMTALMEAVTFFSTANGNTLTDPLSIDGLTAAEQLFLDAVDADGKPLLLTPSILLVPTSLAATARQLLASTELARTGDNAPTGSPFAGQYELLVSPYLNNAEYTGNSATQWFLLTSASSGVAALEIVYLNGRDAPTIESGDVDFAQLGAAVRGYWDFGIALQDHRGAVRSSGTGT